MEIINRYVYSVSKRLPEAQRKDVADELRGLIEDMLEERVQDREVTEEDVEMVLLELGHPRILARKYRGEKRHVIGPELYDLYILVLKIALISTIAVNTAIFVIQVIVNPMNILDYFVSFIVSFFTVIIPMVFGWTTLGFALAEYFSEGRMEKLELEKGWKPSSLPAVPDEKRQIKRSEPITGIVIYVLLIIMLAFSNEYFGIWIFREGELSGVIPFLNENLYSSVMILAFILFGSGIVKEYLKLFYEKWTYKLVTFITIVNVVSIGLILFLITGFQIWNPNFMNELIQYGMITRGSEGYDVISQIWEQLTFWTVIFLVFGLLFDLIAGFVKVRKAK
ncbi:HAAS signaling domain-containing protein [Halobacillus naozhouensis]|uniref:ABC-2 type transport system permease protein n=1 Tax=Halobacillus naozhouensis TaxID=554880 RepID=A0ABY8J622_9BACI|nr:hypothetical protein [Halobacillus naozhouensis]WFT76406.1 hypothetical protein P9989_08600 [Halobacillus naozhouensis]